MFHEDGSRTVLTALPATFGMQIENETKVRLKSSGHKILKLHLGPHDYCHQDHHINKIKMMTMTMINKDSIYNENYVLLNHPGYHHLLEHYHQDH